MCVSFGVVWFDAVTDGDAEPVTFAMYVADLWRQAGYPTARAMAAGAGVSHTTANELVRRGEARKWSTIAPVLELLNADIERAADLWEQARPPAIPGAQYEPVQVRLARIEGELFRLSQRMDEVLRRLPGA